MRKILTFLILKLYIAGMLFSSFATTTYADGEEPGIPEFPMVNSQYFVVMDADSGEVLYSSNADSICYPASTTKLMTSLLVIENCVLTDQVTFSQEAVDSIETGDANVSILPGEILTVEQSLYCLILRSANEVAYGLAEHTAGTMEAFAEMMTNRAIQLGTTNTNFANPSGLTDARHYTTPRDLSLIARACFDNKTLMRIVSYPGLYTIKPTNVSNYTRYYRPRYKMLSGGDYAYEYSCGGKTGYTSAAGNCLVSFAEKDGLRLICTILNSTEKNCYNDTTTLFNYFFNNYHKEFLDKLTNVDLKLSDDPYLLVPNGITMDMLNRHVIYSDNEEYHGAEGGFARIDYLYGETLIGTITAYASNNTPTGLPGTNGVRPHSFETSTENVEPTYVNLRYIFYISIGVLVLILLILLIVYGRKKNSGIKKLRF